MKNTGKIILILFISLCFVRLSAYAQPTRSKIDQLLSAYARLDRFSGTVLVAKNGRVMFVKAYGAANLDFNIQNTVETKFDIGSITKEFTAVAILQLVSEGNLSLDKPILEYLPDYPKEQGAAVTLHHLLTHTSGIPSPGRIGDGLDTIEAGVHPYSTNDLLSLFKDKPLLFKPGTHFRYSNSGYIVLAAIIEKVSGQSFQDYLAEQIFKPAQMFHTTVRRSDRVLLNRATGYDGYGEAKFNAQYAHPSFDLGAGGIYSTVGDLFKWDQVLYGNRILPTEYKDKMFTRFVKTDFNGPAETYYGYGWQSGDLFGQKVLAHYGGSDGFLAVHYRFPAQRTVVIVLSNYHPSAPFRIHDEIVRKISAIIFGQAYEMPPSEVQVAPNVLSRYVGEYEVSPGFIVSITLRRGKMWAETAGEAWTLFNYWGGNKQQLESSEFALRTRQLFESLDKKQFAAAAREFDGGVLGSDPDQLARMWETLTAQLGTLKRVSVVNIRNLENRTPVTARIEFEKAAVVFNLAYDRTKHVISFSHFVGPPSTVQLTPKSATDFFVNGFSYMLRDVSLKFNYDKNGNVVNLVLDQDSGVIAKKIGGVQQ